MLAVGMRRGAPGVHSFNIPKPEIKQPDEVLVRIKEVGLDGTDFNMVRYGLPDIAEGRNELVMGHEMVGVVEEVGSAVKSLAPGDPVTMTVRRGCGICHPCLHNQSDMCMTGLFTERGIHQLDGFLTQYAVDQEQYIVKVPSSLAKSAVLAEPLSIVEKGIAELRIIQSRFPWTCPHPEHTFDSPHWGGCKTALVVGAGPLGLMATALLRLAAVHTYVSEIVPEDHPKIGLVKRMKGRYIDARTKSPKELVDLCCSLSSTGNLEIIFEASGAADTALGLINYMTRSSIYVMTGIPRGDAVIQVDAAQLVRQIVRFNQVVFGSVNSNRRHFEMALTDMEKIDSQFPGLLHDIFTERLPLSEFRQAFIPRESTHIKTIIEIEPWD